MYRPAGLPIEFVTTPTVNSIIREYILDLGFSFLVGRGGMCV